MILCTLIRRFRINGALVELSHLAELPPLPPAGWTVDFSDTSGAAKAAWGRLTLRTFSPGIHPPQIAIYFDTEAPEKLAPAREAGWKEMEGTR